MRLLPILAAAALLSASLIARADDTYTTYDLSANFQASGGGVITGALVLDTSSNTFTSADLTVSGFPAALGNGTLNLITGQGTSGRESYVDIGDTNADSLSLYFPAGALAGNSGAAICTDVTPTPLPDCAAFGTIYDGDLAGDGTLEPAPTPEPSSVLLLTTGLLGLAGIARRRIA